MEVDAAAQSGTHLRAQRVLLQRSPSGPVSKEEFPPAEEGTTFFWWGRGGTLTPATSTSHQRQKVRNYKGTGHLIQILSAGLALEFLH